MGTLTVMTVCKLALLVPVAAVLLSAQPAPASGARHTAAQRYELFQKNLALRGAAITRQTSFEALTISKTGSCGVRKFVANFSTCWGWTLCLHARL